MKLRIKYVGLLFGCTLHLAPDYLKVSMRQL